MGIARFDEDARNKRVWTAFVLRGGCFVAPSGMIHGGRQRRRGRWKCRTEIRQATELAGKRRRNEVYAGTRLCRRKFKINTPLELNVPPAGTATWWYAGRQVRSLSDGIIPPLFCCLAATNWAFDGDGRRSLFLVEVYLPHIVRRM